MFVRDAVPFGHVGVGYGEETSESKSLRELCHKCVTIFVYLGWPADDAGGYVWDIVIRNLSDVVAEINAIQVFIGNTFAPRLRTFNSIEEYFELGGKSRRPTLRFDSALDLPEQQAQLANQVVDALQRGT